MEKQTGRLEAFSDGIFGVAITLLAIEIGIKEYAGATNLNLWHRILALWPEYFTYFNSFATILLVWIGHQKIIERLRLTNHWVVMLNGLVLLLVVLFPYPTKMVGTFIGTEAQETAVAFYAGFTGTISVALLLLNVAIVKNPRLLVNAKLDIPWFHNMIRGQIIAVATYAFAAALAFFSSYAALAITFLMWVFWTIATRDGNKSD
ncbi:MAG: TMEM175 family protein [Burkholderiales bacterium]